MPLILKHADITHLLSTLTPSDYPALITALTTALLFPPALQQPPRQSLPTPTATTLIMPCTLPPTTSIKTVTLPSAQPPKASITLFSSATGALTAILSADTLTAFRTALVSLLLLHQRIQAGLACRRAVVFGAGLQATWVCRLLRTWCARGCEITVVGRRDAGELRERMRGEGVGVLRDTDAGVEEAVRGADAVFCCTPATEPLFPAEWLGGRREVYVSLIGSYRPEMREVEPAVLRGEGVTVVVDERAACLREAGEVIAAGLGAGEMRELGEVLAGGEAVGGVCVFKCVGLAVMDLVVAREMVRMAEERGVGTQVEGYE